MKQLTSLTHTLLRSEHSIKDKTYTNHLLVDSVHTSKRPRQRAEWLKLEHRIEDALMGQGDLFEEPDEEVRATVAKVRTRQAKAAEHDSGEPAH